MKPRKTVNKIQDVSFLLFLANIISNMKSILSYALFFLIAQKAFGQPEKVKIQIRERTNDPISLDSKEESTWFDNQLSLDPAWMTRGTVLLGYERVVSNFLSARLHVGVSTRDYLDGLLYDGIINEGLEIQSVNPSLSYGAEVRYYADESSGFDVFFTGIGFLRRNYSYDGFLRFETEKVANKTYQTSSNDLYIRYGGYIPIQESKKFKLSLELGLCAGLTYASYYTFTTFQTFDFLGNPTTFATTSPETAFSYLIQPNVAFNIAF